MKFYTCCPPFPGKHHLALMVSLVPCFGIQPQPSSPPSPSSLIDHCHLGRSLLTENSQISHLYQKVVTPRRQTCFKLSSHIVVIIAIKILERIIYNRLLSPLLTNSLLSNSQFGFHPCSSTQEALTAATTSWHQYLEEKQSVAAVFFDLSKAFDSVPHLGIFRALTQVGVTGSLRTWFAD